MRNRIREIRKAHNLTLADVAARCLPPTTSVTIGRIETGTRQLTTTWMERIAAALQVEPSQLLHTQADSELPVAAQLDADGANALSAPLMVTAPVPSANAIALIVRESQGEYRSGDQVWLEQLPPERFNDAVNTDVLVPRPVGRFVFGRLIATDQSRLHILPTRQGSRQTVVADAPWIARVTHLIRQL